MERYVLQAKKELIDERFGVRSKSAALYEPSYNIYPGTQVPIIFNKPEPTLAHAIWGLDDKAEKYSISKSDLLGDPKLLQQLRTQACIIPASGFYKWKDSVDDPLPFYVRMINQEVLGLAGFYSFETDSHGNTRYRFSAITMPANVLLMPLDDSMPCILEEEDFYGWLQGEAPNILARSFKNISLMPDLAVYRVPRLVNDPSKNSKELIQPIPKVREERDEK